MRTAVQIGAIVLVLDSALIGIHQRNVGLGSKHCFPGFPKLTVAIV
jgi:hypothetical protein